MCSIQGVDDRRWMIRAFAVGIGVGTIRLWIGLLTGLSAISMADSFALAFWLGLGMNVAAGELWVALRGRNGLDEVAR